MFRTEKDNAFIQLCKSLQSRIVETCTQEEMFHYTEKTASDKYLNLATLIQHTILSMK